MTSRVSGWTRATRGEMVRSAMSAAPAQSERPAAGGDTASPKRAATSDVKGSRRAAPDAVAYVATGSAGSSAPADALAGMLAGAVAARAAPLATRRTLARFEPGEHVQFGLPGRTVTLGGEEVEERYVIAMADFYRDPEALLREKRTNIASLVALIRRDEATRSRDAPEAELIKEEAWTEWSKGAGHKEGERYMDLNKRNEGHFEGLNKERWLKWHRKALRLAGAAGRVTDEARIYNAFANHFLTDAFSAGHMFDKVATKARAKPGIDDKANRRRLAREIARAMLADKAIRDALSTQEVKSTVVPVGGSWGPATDEQQLFELLDSVLYWTASAMDDSFLSIPVKLAHDELNEGVRSNTGPLVFHEAPEQRGHFEEWQLPGDTALAADRTGLTLKYGRRAVQATLANLEHAAQAKGKVDLERMIDNVLRWLPITTRAADVLVEAAVARAADFASAETRARIVALSLENFPTAIEQFRERKVIQPLGTDARQRSAAAERAWQEAIEESRKAGYLTAP